MQILPASPLVMGGDGIADSLGGHVVGLQVGSAEVVGAAARCLEGCRLGSVYLFVCFDVKFVLWC